MQLKQILIFLRIVFSKKIRDIYCTILFNWILYIKSQPLSLNQKSAIIFAPHQDDETFGCAGIIALKRSLNIPVKVVFITDGRVSKPSDIKSEEIINIRYQEALNALEILGVLPSNIHFIGQIDNHLKGLSYEQQNKIIIELSHLLKSFNTEEAYVPYRYDIHPDHEVTYSLVQRAIEASNMTVELWQYPVWLFWQNPLSLRFKFPVISSVYRISIELVQHQKNRAIASYHSQIKTLPSGLINCFLSPYEIFFKD
ncbi:LmbE-like protein [Nostoc carneum NIES-2107]|nr:LmbE-like protein [Nostoc carneum NIES-2107]